MTNARRAKERRDVYRAHGLCPECGAAPSGGFTLCAGCRIRRRAARSARYVPSMHPVRHECAVCGAAGHNACTCPLG